MLRYAIFRALYGVIALLAVSIVLFSFFRANHWMDEWLVFDTFEDHEWYERVRAESGVDDPWMDAYLSHIFKRLQGDLGLSRWEGKTVSGTIMSHLVNSLLVVGPAALIGIFLSLGLGVAGSAKPRSLLDFAGNTLAIVARSTPHFVVAILLMGVLVILLDWVPPQGKSGFVSWLLPTAVLTVSTLVTIPFIRQAIQNQFATCHVMMARIKGIPEWKIVLRHVLPVVAMVPSRNVVSGVSTFLGELIVVEVIFAWPGLGNMVLFAISAGDHAVLHGLLLVIAGSLIALSILVDIALAFADPRIRFPEPREYEATLASP